MANNTNKYYNKVHMSHCNQGLYVGNCKYGKDDTCPALNAPSEQSEGLKDETTRV